MSELALKIDGNTDENNATCADGNGELNECTIQVPIKRTKRTGKVDFVRFNSKETVYTDQDEVRAKIKDEINR